MKRSTAVVDKSPRLPSCSIDNLDASYSCYIAQQGLQILEYKWTIRSTTSMLLTLTNTFLVRPPLHLAGQGRQEDQFRYLRGGCEAHLGESRQEYRRCHHHNRVRQGPHVSLSPRYLHSYCLVWWHFLQAPMVNHHCTIKACESAAVPPCRRHTLVTRL